MPLPPLGQTQLHHRCAEAPVDLRGGQSVHTSWLPAPCAQLHTSPGTRCLSPRPAICHDADLWALLRRFVPFSIPRVSVTAFSVLPRCITHCITTPVTLHSPMSVCCSETPTSPEIPICAVIASSVVCDLGPSLTPGDAECLRLLFHPEKEE